MANAITDMNSTILANAIFESFLDKITPLTRFARNFSAAAAKRGDKVRVNLVSSADAAATFAGSYNIQDADADGTDITLGAPIYTSWGLTDLELANNPELSLEMFAAQKANKLAKAVLQSVWANITVANFANEIEVTAANFDSDEVADLREDANVLNWPEEMRSLILGPADMTGLLKDGDIKASDAFGGSEAIRQGKVPVLYGFGVLESNLIPANAENLRSFAAYPDALAVAMRYHAPQSGHNYNEAMAMTDPESGITLGFRSWYDPKTGTMNNVMDAIVGSAVGNGSSLIRIQTP